MTHASPATGEAETPALSYSLSTTARDWIFSKRKPKPAELDLRKPPATGIRALFRARHLNGTTLEYQAMKYPPTEQDISLFEALKEPRQRQAILVRLRMLEKEINLKPLPVVTSLVTLAAATVGLSLASSKATQTGFYDLYLTGIIYFLATASVIVLLAIRSHTSREACLNAWTEAFEDSHSLQRKLEEERRKATEEASSAEAPADGTMPTVVRYAWAVRIFG